MRSDLEHGSIAAVTSDTKGACYNGLVQTFGIHIENLLIATITAFAVCLSDYQNLIVHDPNGIEITLYAFQFHIGNIGPVFITITIALFGLATLFTGYYYGESSLKYLKKATKLDIFLLKIITLGILILGSVISSNLLWAIIDIMVGIIAIINIYALFALRKIILEEYRYYELNQKE